jgi:hypothetical protein
MITNVRPELIHLLQALIPHYVSFITGQQLSTMTAMFWVTYYGWRNDGHYDEPNYEERQWIFEQILAVNISDIQKSLNSLVSFPTLQSLYSRARLSFIRWAVPVFVITGARSPTKTGDHDDKMPSSGVYSGFRTRGTEINVSMVYKIQKRFIVILRTSDLTIYHHTDNLKDALTIIKDRFPSFKGKPEKDTFYQRDDEEFLISTRPGIYLPLQSSTIPAYIDAKMTRKRKSIISVNAFGPYFPMTQMFHLGHGITVTWTLKIDIPLQIFQCLLYKYFYPIITQVDENPSGEPGVEFESRWTPYIVETMNMIEDNFPKEALSLYLPPVVLQEHFDKVRREVLRF